MAKARYGTRHQALRARLLRTLVPGSPCLQPFADGTICGKPMDKTQRLHLGHDDNGGYIGLVHASCNDRAAQQKAALLRWRTCRNCGGPYQSATLGTTLCPRCDPGGPRPPEPSPGRAW